MATGCVDANVVGWIDPVDEFVAVYWGTESDGAVG